MYIYNNVVKLLAAYTLLKSKQKIKPVMIVIVGGLGSLEFYST
jgi:hypothetical protein